MPSCGIEPGDALRGAPGAGGHPRPEGEIFRYRLLIGTYASTREAADAWLRHTLQLVDQMLELQGRRIDDFEKGALRFTWSKLIEHRTRGAMSLHLPLCPKAETRH